MIAPPTYANQFVVTQMASFIDANPDIYFSLEIATSEDVINGVLADHFDLGILGVELTRAGAKLIPFRRSSAACVLPPDHPLAGRKTIHPENLQGERLIAISYRHARREQLEKLLRETDTNAQIVAEVSTSTAAVDLVRLGLGIAVVNPFPTAQFNAQGVVYRPFASAITYQTYFAAPDKRPLSRAARHFMRHIRLHTRKDEFSEPA